MLTTAEHWVVHSLFTHKVYKKAFGLVETPDQDKSLFSKFQALTWVGQNNFDFRAEFRDDAVTTICSLFTYCSLFGCFLCLTLLYLPHDLVSFQPLVVQVVPYYMAIAKLRGINYCTTPVRKLYAICDAAKV